MPAGSPAQILVMCSSRDVHEVWDVTRVVGSRSARTRESSLTPLISPWDSGRTGRRERRPVSA